MATSPDFEERVAEGYGLIEAPFEGVVKAVRDGRLNPPHAKFKGVNTRISGARALEFLRRLTSPPSRYVVLPLDEDVTAVVNNDRNGSDVADYFVRFAHVLGTRVARVVDTVPRTWTGAGRREVLSYEARIFELVDGAGTRIKTIHCVNDGGRWSWFNEGATFSVEAEFNYAHRVIKKRFTREDLGRLVVAAGLTPLAPHAISAAGSLCAFEVRQNSWDWQRRIDAGACTPEERDDPAHGYFQRGLGWVKHMDTHFESVIADFERALAINSAYEARVRRYLKKAYKLAGRRR